MFTTKDIRQELNRLDKESGIDTSKIPIRISTRMTSTWGKCVYGRTRSKVTVKELVFADRLLRWATYEHLLEVIRHEYAHAYVLITFNKPGEGHSSRWRYWAIRFGSSGKRCNNFPEVDSDGRAEQTAKYIVTCTTCGTIFKYQRRSKIVQALERNPGCTSYICSKCHGHNFLLKRGKNT